jgi:hypothetical protein
VSFDCTKHIDTARKLFAHAIDFHREIEGGDSYALKASRDVIFGIVERFLADAPFHVGDRVELTMTPEITQDSGWRGSKHFLIKGARGIVLEVDFDPERKTLFGLVEFDDETYIHFQTKEALPVTHKHVYRFSERWLRRVSEEKTEEAANG